LSHNDRLAGAYRLTLKHRYPCDAILKGIAAGFLFAEPSDASAMRIQKHITVHGIASSVRAFTGIDNEDAVWAIIGYYNELKR